MHEKNDECYQKLYIIHIYGLFYLHEQKTF